MAFRSPETRSAYCNGLTVIGIIIGIPAGVGVLQYLLTALATEYELKLTLGWATWLVSVLLTFGVSLVVGQTPVVQNL